MATLLHRPHPMGHDCGMDIIDTRGLMCPLPVLRAAKALRGLRQGGVVTVWADDPIAVVDIPHFCSEAGHRLLSQTQTTEHSIYVIERGPDPT